MDVARRPIRRADGLDRVASCRPAKTTHGIQARLVSTTGIPARPGNHGVRVNVAVPAIAATGPTRTPCRRQNHVPAMAMARCDQIEIRTAPQRLRPARSGQFGTYQAPVPGSAANGIPPPCHGFQRGTCHCDRPRAMCAAFGTY